MFKRSSGDDNFIHAICRLLYMAVWAKDSFIVFGYLISMNMIPSAAFLSANTCLRTTSALLYILDSYK